jgi:hypothetical protein
MEGSMRISDLVTQIKAKAGAALARWRQQQRATEELTHCDAVDLAKMANDFGIGANELKRLAACGPDSADLLQQRLRQIGLPAGAIELPVMRDLQRCCSFCADQKVCRHELEHPAEPSRWPSYCPNAPTLAALTSKKFGSAKRGDNGRVHSS